MTVVAPRAALEVVADAGSKDAGNHAARAKRLGLPMLGIYGFGGLAENVPIYGLTHLLLFYLTIVCGMSGSAAGLILGLALIMDGIAEPLIGSLSDNSHSRHGRRHPFMLVGAIPLALGFGLLFSIPPGITGVALFACALALLLSVRVGYAVFNVPFVALGAELTDDYHERSLVVASRLLFSQLAGALVAFLAFGVFMKGSGALTHREAYMPFAWCCAAIVFVGTGISIIGTLGSRDRLHAAAASQRFGLRRFVAELGELFRNPSFRALFFTALAFMAGWGLAGALGLYAYKYFWKLTTPEILIVNEIGIAGAAVGIFLAAGLRRVMQKRTMAILGMSVAGVCQLSLVPLRLAGLIPQDAAVIAVTLSTVLSYAGLIINAVGYQSMMADAADEHEHLFGARREGLCYSGTTLAVMVSTGIGAVVAGTALDLIGFPHGLSKTASHLVIPADTLRDLGLIYGPGAGLLTIVGVVIMFNYRLGKGQHAEIREALVRRRNPGTL